MPLLPHETATFDETASAHDTLHRALAHFNRRRLTPSLPRTDWMESLEDETRIGLLERYFLERERRRVTARAAEAPREPAAFADWFTRLRERGPGQGDPLFPYLADEASLEELRWFVRQEAAGEAGFDDLVALAQVRMPARPKLELARNYWDEMGRGREVGMHGPMLTRMTEELGVEGAIEGTVWESLALGNLLAGLASNRDYAFHAVGALGVVELTAPGRAVQVERGLRRLGISKEARTYFALHGTLDVKHYEAWCAEVLVPLVTDRPELAPALAEGALMRLEAGARCFARYRALALGG